MKKKLFWGILGVLLMGNLIFWGIYKFKGPDEQTKIEKKFDIVKIEPRDLSKKIETTGKVVLTQNGDLYAAYAGTISQINYQVGQQVTKGDLLMVINSATLKKEWAETEFNYKKALLNLAQAQKELARVQILFAAQGVTIDELEEVKKQVDLYQAEVKLTKFKLDELKIAPDAANFMAQDRSELWLKAPYDGEITWISIKPGEKVAAQGLLMSLMAEGALEVEASVDESEIGLVKVGQEVKVVLNDQDQTMVRGVVAGVGKSGNEEAEVVVFPVKIKLKENTQRVRSGMSADVTIIISTHKEAIVIPNKGVIRRGAKSLVRLWNGVEIKRVPVRLGGLNGTNIKILSGLQNGDLVAVPKFDQKKAGQNGKQGKKNSLLPFGPYKGRRR